MLKDEAVRSAKIYLEYLIAHKDEGLGRVRARVRGMQGSLLDGEIMLITDRIIRSAEGLVMRIGGTVYENTAEKEAFRVMSITRRKVMIAPSEEVAAHMEAAWESQEPIILETDLTFLVKRVLNWYEKYGNRVELPSAWPDCRLDPDNPITLSDNQYDCAVLAMTSPLSYIWGAPGTGKTKHVLASCVLSCIRAGKKVILAAPTNNALEQSLGGLLRALYKEAGMNPAGRVVRLGAPSDYFRLAWPEVCEDGAVDWMKADIREKIGEADWKLSRIEQQWAEMREDNAARKGHSHPKHAFFRLDQEKRNLTAEKQALLNKSRKLTESGNILSVISDFSVVAATVDSCLFRIPPDSAFRPDHIFLDEAGYCNVIKGMTLLGFGKPVTLLGDHMQLPPVFEGEQDLLQDPKKQLARLWKISSLYMEDAVLCGDLAVFSARDPAGPPRFDRMVREDLVETYRFGPELAKILARRVYDPRFCSRSGNETKILFVDAPKKPEDKGKDEEGKHRRISHSEAKAARALAEANMSRLGVTMGIITPYRKQRRLLSETMERLYRKYKLEEEDMEDDIVTVHQSQGREWDIVLFSVTDCFDEAHFTDTVRVPEALKLVNTAISRAKKMLILIGDAESWRKKNGQIISELFAVGTEISEKEPVADALLRQGDTDDSPPWMDNYGSLHFAADTDE